MPFDITPRDLEAILGDVGASSSVIASHDGHEPLGFRCDSARVLSTDPLLITFNPSRDSVLWPRIRDVGMVVVNVMATSRSTGWRNGRRLRLDDVNFQWAPSPSGAPVVDGAIAWAECEVCAEHDGGDHTIVVARVVRLHSATVQEPRHYRGSSYYIAPPVLLADVDANRCPGPSNDRYATSRPDRGGMISV